MEKLNKKYGKVRAKVDGKNHVYLYKPGRNNDITHDISVFMSGDSRWLTLYGREQDVELNVVGKPANLLIKVPTGTKVKIKQVDIWRD